MPKYMNDWESLFSPVARYPFLSWSEFALRSTETDVVAPAPFFYCKQKAGIPAEATLLQAGVKSGGDDGIP